MEILINIDNWWIWWSLALLLVILEIFSPGAFFIWLGIAAAVTGIINMLFPTWGWQYHVLLFALLTLVSMIVWHKYSLRHPLKTDEPLLNQRSAQYIGRTFTLKEGIQDGQGRIHVDDSYWKIHGADCTPGSKVKVVDAKGVILYVEISQ